MIGEAMRLLRCLPARRRLLRSSLSSSSSSSTTTTTEAVTAYAQDEVRRARRRAREEEDEACLFNAAWRAARGTVDALDLSAPEFETREGRRRAIDVHVARQVALLMGSLLGPLGHQQLQPGVPPPGMSYAIEVGPSTIPDADDYDGAAVAAAVEALAKERVEKEGEDSIDDDDRTKLAMAVPGGAGRGLVIRGRAAAGDVIAFYPGTVYRSEDVRWSGGYGAMLRRAAKAGADNGAAVCGDYMLGRVGGFVIDGLGSGYTLHASELDDRDGGANKAAAYRAYLEARDAAAPPTPPGLAAAGLLGNAWANGHFANHPPRGKTANVVGWPYDFPVANLPERLLPLLPNSYAVRAPPATDSMACADSVSHKNALTLCPHTIVLVAAVDLEDGEEAFLDYGFEQASDGQQQAPASSPSSSSSSSSSSDASTSSSVPPWFFPARLRGDVLVTAEDDGALYDDEGRPVPRPLSPRDEAYNALMEWKAAFAAKHPEGKGPGVRDLMGDPQARALFEEFQKHNPLEWDEGDDEGQGQGQAK